jgi:hypothetical protein
MSSGSNLSWKLFHNPFLKGHGFSRADDKPGKSRASALEGFVLPAAVSVMKQHL